MFERKNQNILSEHYNKLIEKEPEVEDDDFITLKRADHELSEDSLNEVKMDNLSKRKQKLGKAKRTLILNASTRNKLVFDEEGNAREAHNVADADEWMKERGGMSGVVEEGTKYAETERGKMKLADMVDRQEAKEKRKEKKRKRKERERGQVVSPSCEQLLLFLMVFFRMTKMEELLHLLFPCQTTTVTFLLSLTYLPKGRIAIKNMPGL